MWSACSFIYGLRGHPALPSGPLAHHDETAVLQRLDVRMQRMAEVDFPQLKTSLTEDISWNTYVLLLALLTTFWHSLLDDIDEAHLH